MPTRFTAVTLLIAASVAHAADGDRTLTVRTSRLVTVESVTVYRTKDGKRESVGELTKFDKPLALWLIFRISYHFVPHLFEYRLISSHPPATPGSVFHPFIFPRNFPSPRALNIEGNTLTQYGVLYWRSDPAGVEC
jgi:hypothetical protein